MYTLKALHVLLYLEQTVLGVERLGAVKGLAPCL